MMHRAWSSTVEVPYCFSRSYVKFQGHPALKIVEFDSNWAFPDCNSTLNSPMAMKCCTKLETAKERCSIVFLGHPSNFKVTWYKTSPILTQIGRFRTIGRSQLSNPSDLPCYFDGWKKLPASWTVLSNELPVLCKSCRPRREFPTLHVRQSHYEIYISGHALLQNDIETSYSSEQQNSISISMFNGTPSNMDLIVNFRIHSGSIKTFKTFSNIGLYMWCKTQ